MTIWIYSGCVKIKTSHAKQCHEPNQLILFKQHNNKQHNTNHPPKNTQTNSPHKQRPFLHARYPIHITLQIIHTVDNLHQHYIYQTIRETTLTTTQHEDFRIVQLSIQQTHIHLLIKTNNKHTLTKKIQDFQISTTKHLNATISKNKPSPRRKNIMFRDHYHAEIITSPRQTRQALSYVANNWRKHQKDLRAPMSDWTID